MTITAGTKQLLLSRVSEMSVLLLLGVGSKAWHFASSNRVAVLQASCTAGDLAPRLSGTSNLQLGGGAEAEAAPPGQSRAVGPPGLPKRLKARPRDMPGTALASCCHVCPIQRNSCVSVQTALTSQGDYCDMIPR